MTLEGSEYVAIKRADLEELFDLVKGMQSSTEELANLVMKVNNHPDVARVNVITWDEVKTMNGDNSGPIS
jgi:hypothetical protein